MVLPTHAEAEYELPNIVTIGSPNTNRARLAAGLQILECDHALHSVTFCDGQQVGEANTLVSVSTLVQKKRKVHFLNGRHVTANPEHSHSTAHPYASLSDEPPQCLMHITKNPWCVEFSASHATLLNLTNCSATRVTR